MITETELVLDKTDLHILRLMQDNARISNADLARELGMAPSGVLERVKKLEAKGVIQQYTARINPEALQQNRDDQRPLEVNHPGKPHARSFDKIVNAC